MFALARRFFQALSKFYASLYKLLPTFDPFSIGVRAFSASK
jgi:hypothetical protein